MKYCAVCKAKYDDGISFCAVDGEVLEDDPSSIVGTVLDGQYQIESLLGKGGMGAVFRARHILLGDRVAIKVLPPEMRSNAEWLRRFRREGQAARRFRHPNAVTVYDLRTASDGMIYMVMEYVEGHTLDAELKARGHFTPADAVSALEPIMSVLNAAHAMGVVHRDLKPENIMIGKASTGGEPNVKLLDLGIAKLREVAGVETGKSTALTMAGQMLGTPYYMSPEQWGELPRDGNSEIDGRADIYSLGLVFYEMIAGRRPYSALTLLELRKEHVSVTPRRLDEVVSGVSRAFSDVIARAMAKDRSERPATTGELAAELKAALLAADNGVAQFVSAIDDVAGSHSPAVTVAIDKGARTKSDVNAPTIITMDAAAPLPADPSPPVASAPHSTAPTLVEPGSVISKISTPDVVRDELSWEPEETTPAVAKSTAPVSTPVPAPLGPSRAPLLIGGVLILVLIVAGVGGFLLLKGMRTTSGNEPGTTGANNNPNGPGVPAMKEVARYWLEVASDDGSAKSAQVVPVIPIASGQLFKFHFQPGADGFLYLVGPGPENKPTAFLTGNPDAEATGLSSNEVKQGVGISFPTGNQSDGEERWLSLDKKPGTENYTLIFSPTRLDSPSFLNRAEPGHSLTAAEQQEFSSFVSRYSGSSVNDYNNLDRAAPFVLVKAPASPSTTKPLVLDIRIEHR
jgi:serine/threonine protein kinase